VLTLGLGTSFHGGEDTREENALSYKVTAGTPSVYLWGSADTNETGLLGQPFSKNDMLSFGLGARKQWGDFSSYLELGYAEVDQSTHQVIQQEVVYTQLVNNHYVYNRPVPIVLGGPYDQQSYDTTYDISGGLMGRLGVTYNLSDQWGVTVAYRFFEPEAYYSMTGVSILDAGETARWEENTKVDMSAIELGIEWKWGP